MTHLAPAPAGVGRSWDTTAHGRMIIVKDTLPGMEDDYDPRPYIASQRWVYAKTVPTHPHEYVVPEVTTQPSEHYRMVKWINRVGTPRMFAGKRYKYAEVDGYVYWIGPRTIINRRRVDVVQDTEHYPG